jgi:hypothetical protein
VYLNLLEKEYQKHEMPHTLSHTLTHHTQPCPPQAMEIALRPSSNSLDKLMNHTHLMNESTAILHRETQEEWREEGRKGGREERQREVSKGMEEGRVGGREGKESKSVLDGRDATAIEVHGDGARKDRDMTQRGAGPSPPHFFFFFFFFSRTFPRCSYSTPLMINRLMETSSLQYALRARET